MAITWLVPARKQINAPLTDKAELLNAFDSHKRITIASGFTCAYLGDQRNLREFLIAAEAVRTLKKAGKVVQFYLFDDSLDALNAKQLRIAAEKDAQTIQRFQQFCGMPICDVPSPDGESESWSDHFEKLLLKRLAEYDCFPILESSAHLYASGVYAPFVKIVLERSAEITRFLRKEFPGYTPQALYYPICPACGRIKGTVLHVLSASDVEISCETCGIISILPLTHLRGKLNWKLDCAARWRAFSVDAEPFTKSYLEPNAGAFWIARAIGNEFFGKTDVHPMQIGVVKVADDLDARSLSCLPPRNLSSVFVEHWTNDITLSRERVLLAASRDDPVAGCSYIESMRRLLPYYRAKRTELTSPEYDFLRRAELFQSTILNQGPEPLALCSDLISNLDDLTLRGAKLILNEATELRKKPVEYAVFDAALKAASLDLNDARKAVHAAIRKALVHNKGLPIRRLLFVTPLATLDLLAFAIDRTLDMRGAAMQLAQERVPKAAEGFAVVNLPATVVDEAMSESAGSLD